MGGDMEASWVQIVARWPGLTVRKYLPLRDTPAPGGGGGDGAPRR